MDFYRGGYPRRSLFPPRNFGSMPYYEMSDSSFGMGRGYGKSGPASFCPPLRGRPKDHPCIPFLISCGVAPKHAYNLPVVLMEIMEPHFCGVCEKPLPNFEAAKDHYLSKGHYKKQKKFIADRMKAPEYPPINCPIWKVPMKSRDVYCELCDVQITSKVHAESHYAGKSHKAIVYGRKPPKNKVLNCEPMSKRITKLIRREKRIYNEKAEVEEKEEVEQPEEDPEPPKPPNPDFYCDVCKTSVTSSEQMIMHRNGRKHLIKEKQFILKSMSGKADLRLLNYDLVHDLKQEMEDLRTQLESAHIEIASLNSEVTTLKTEKEETIKKPSTKSKKDPMEHDGEEGENHDGENGNNGENHNDGESNNEEVKADAGNNGGEGVDTDKNEWGKDPGDAWGKDIGEAWGKDPGEAWETDTKDIWK